MKFPKRLKIGGQWINLVISDDVPGENNGFWDSRKATIWIYKTMPETEKEVTLIHEILHAMNNEIPHREIEALAQGLYQVIKDNGLVFDGREVKK